MRKEFVLDFYLENDVRNPELYSSADDGRVEEDFSDISGDRSSHAAPRSDRQTPANVFSDYSETVIREFRQYSDPSNAPSEEELNKYVALFASEVGQRKISLPSEFIPPYIHRFSASETEERTASHNRAVDLICSRLEASLNNLSAANSTLKNNESDTVHDLLYPEGLDRRFDFETLRLWTVSFVDQTPEEFMARPRAERTALFRTWLGNLTSVLQQSAVYSDDRSLLSFAEDNKAFFTFGFQLDVDSIELLAKQFNLDLSKNGLGKDLENYTVAGEPFLDTAQALDQRLFDMADPTYPAFDPHDIRAIATLRDNFPAFSKSLPSDRFFREKLTLSAPADYRLESDSESPARLSHPFAGFSNLSSPDCIPAGAYCSDVPLSSVSVGAFSASLDLFLKNEYPGKDNLAFCRFLNPENPEAPLDQLDDVTARLMQGKEVFIKDYRGNLRSLSADLSTGQIVNRPEIPTADLRQADAVSALSSRLMLKLENAQTRSPSASSEFKAFDTALRSFSKLSASDVEKRTEAAEKVFQTADAYVKSKLHTDKKFTEKTFRRLALAKEACSLFANVSAFHRFLNANPLVRVSRAPSLEELMANPAADRQALADAYRKRSEEQNERSVPGLFSGAYKAAYRREEKFLESVSRRLETMEKSEESRAPVSSAPEVSEEVDAAEQDELKQFLLDSIRRDRGENPESAPTEEEPTAASEKKDISV